MIRSCLRASARGYARQLSISHGVEAGGIVEARRWCREADRLRHSADLETLNQRQRAALRRRAAVADHRAIWCAEAVG